MRERGLKFNKHHPAKSHGCHVAPVRERGLKYTSVINHLHYTVVAPVRERGLKYLEVKTVRARVSRSREGAWIEIGSCWRLCQSAVSRSREGAWIEIYIRAALHSGCSVAPVRERGLKSTRLLSAMLLLYVAPVRERGLK